MCIDYCKVIENSLRSRDISNVNSCKTIARLCCCLNNKNRLSNKCSISYCQNRSFRTHNFRS